MSLKPDNYKSRLIEKEVEKALKTFGAISIEGPKWCGKTWVGLNESNSCFMVSDFDEYGHKNSDKIYDDVRMALNGDIPHLIDEWQDVPFIWDAVRSEVDRNNKSGRFILTGSSTPKLNKPMHSGAGRIKRIQMRTMSLYEMGESSGRISLSDIMNSEDIGLVKTDINMEHLTEILMCGGWPATIRHDSFDEKIELVRQYLEATIADASTLEGVRKNKENLWLVMKSLARNECTYASVKKIQSDTGIGDYTKGPLINASANEESAPAISYPTVAEYIDVFDRMYLINNQQPFDPKIRSGTRVGKTVKRHLTDPALAIAALNVGKERLMNDRLSFGFFFESMCERDLDIYAKHLGGKLYHYRDDSGMEIDAIIELPNGHWGAFEIKLNASRTDEAAENLLKFRNKMKRDEACSLPCVLCVICGLTEYSYVRKDGIYVVSITDLKP